MRVAWDVVEENPKGLLEVNRVEVVAREGEVKNLLSPFQEGHNGGGGERGQEQVSLVRPHKSRDAEVGANAAGRGIEFVNLDLAKGTIGSVAFGSVRFSPVRKPVLNFSKVGFWFGFKTGSAETGSSWFKLQFISVS